MKIARGEAPQEPLGWELAAGTQVAGFVIEGRLAAGSFGALYQARRGGRRFAIKLVPRDARGEREVDALRRVQELPVVGFHGYGLWPEDAPRFIVLALELVEGEALDVWARRFNPSARELLTRVVLPLVSALGRIHAAGVVHRDVKEANVVVRRTDGQPVLVDFGAAGYAGAPRLTLRMPPGTPEYRSPEVLRFAREWEGEPPPERPGDDLWALGVTLYALLTRTLPFGDRHGPLVNTILADAPEPPHGRNPRVPPPVGELCLRMLAKAPGERPADAAALERDVREALAGAGDAWDVPLFDGGREEPPPSGPGTDAEPVASRGPVRWEAVLALGAVTAVLLVSKAAAPPPALAPMPPTRQEVSRHELAAGDMTGEVVSGAGLPKSPIPAPVAHATHPAEPTMRPTSKNRIVSTAALTAALCTAPACVSSKKILGPPPPTEPCPEGSQRTHELMNTRSSPFGDVLLENYKRREDLAYITIPVRAGPMTAELYDDPWGEIPLGTLFKGQLYIRENIVYGRFTEMLVPGENPMPVCMELVQETIPGALIYGGTRQNPIIPSALELVTVKEFRNIHPR